MTHLDISIGMLALQNQSDNKNYDVYFDPDTPSAADLGLGADVKVTAVFDGKEYKVQDLSISQAKTE